MSSKDCNNMKDKGNRDLHARNNSKLFARTFSTLGMGYDNKQKIQDHIIRMIDMSGKMRLQKKCGNVNTSNDSKNPSSVKFGQGKKMKESEYPRALDRPWLKKPKKNDA